MCACNSCERGSKGGVATQIIMGWRGDRGSYIVSPTPPLASPSGKGRPKGAAGGGPNGEGAGMGAFRVDPRGSNVRGARLRIRSPFRKKEKEEARRSFIFAYEREPLEQNGLRYEKELLENGLREKDDDEVKEEGLLTEEYAAMIEKKEKKMGMALEETEDDEEKNAKEEVDVDFEEEAVGNDTDGEAVGVTLGTESDNVELRQQGNDHDGEDELPFDNSKNKSNASAEDFGSYAVNHGDHLNIVYEDCLTEENEKGGNNLDNDDEAESEESSRLSIETAREVAEAVIEDPCQSEDGVKEEEELEAIGCKNQDGGWMKHREENRAEEISPASNCEVSSIIIIHTKTVDHDQSRHFRHQQDVRMHYRTSPPTVHQTIQAAVTLDKGRVDEAVDIFKEEKGKLFFRIRMWVLKFWHLSWGSGVWLCQFHENHHDHHHHHIYHHGD